MKERLLSMIEAIREHPDRYAKNPGKDFTRRRSLTLPTLISLILTMDEKSMWKGLLGYFQNGIDTPSASAFVQQRKKLLPQAFEDLFHRFTDSLTAEKKFQGYRLLAVDGTSLKSTSYPEDSDAYRPGTQRQHGWNLYHLNALFDLENGIYTDVLVQKEHTKSEDMALCKMVERSVGSEPAILLADRGYEAYNNFAHLEQAGWKYLIRLKDQNRTYAYGVTLPDQPEFDLPVHITLGRLTRRQLEQRGISVPEAYCRLPNNVPFDYLEPGSAGFYSFSARIVRLSLKNGSMETFLQRPLPGRWIPHVAAPSINAASISLMRFIFAAKLCGAGSLTCCPSCNENSCPAGLTAASHVLSLPKTAFPPCMYSLNDLPPTALLFGFFWLT